ncbi:hypothetical protein VTL71DRAFT_15193, partial [Oculimacula yallundae]
MRSFQDSGVKEFSRLPKLWPLEAGNSISSSWWRTFESHLSKESQYNSSNKIPAKGDPCAAAADWPEDPRNRQRPRAAALS